MTSEITANKRRAALLLGGVVLVVAVLGLVVGLLVGALWPSLAVALVLGVGLALGARLSGTRLALSAAGARPAPRAEHPRLHNLVEGLCMASGLAQPALYVIDDPAPNALSAGRSPRHASLAVTTGLLGMLSRVELEGAVAHQLVHIRNGDVGPATLAVPVLGFGLPATARLMRALTGGPERQQEADAIAVQLTRYPPGLVGALEKVGASPRPAAASKRRIAHLWLERPGEPLDERIAALRAL